MLNNCWLVIVGYAVTVVDALAVTLMVAFPPTVKVFELAVSSIEPVEEKVTNFELSGSVTLRLYPIKLLSSVTRGPLEFAVVVLLV